MIGQTRILNNLNKLSIFTIITGKRGQGKKTLAREISKKFNYPIVEVDIKIDSIREMIDAAYNQVSPVIYLIADADNMSLGAKNSLLKIIEEPPQEVYFIMTLQNIENTLNTIKSRCEEIRMDEYYPLEKVKMLQEILPNEKIYAGNIITHLSNYWQMKEVVNYGGEKFFDYVRKIYSHLYKVQGANSFKWTKDIDLKNDGNGYNLEIFFNVYILILQDDLMKALDEEDYKLEEILIHCVNKTVDAIIEMRLPSINKQMLLDKWILNIRKEWLK